MHNIVFYGIGQPNFGTQLGMVWKIPHITYT